MSSTGNTSAMNDLQLKVQLLKNDPQNDTLRTSILQGQVQMSAKQLGVSTTQSANVVRSYPAAYAYTKGYVPKAVLDALNSAQQQIINYDKNKPTLYGMDLVTANHVAAVFAAAAGVTLTISIALVVVGIFVVGPEALAAFAGVTSVVGLFQAAIAAVGADLGAAALFGGGALFLLSQFMGHFASIIPMITKQMVDNGTISQSLQITAIKNVASLEAQLTGTKAPGPYSSAQFDGLINGLQAAGITQVKNPETGITAAFSRQSLADVVNVVYGRQVLAGSPATASKITPLLQPWLLKGSVANSIPLSLYDQVAGVTVPQPVAAPFTAAAAAAPVSRATTFATAKVFTGVVSQGVLGSATSFTPRPDDLITSVGDLETAAANNLAPFIASLGSRIIYEVKIVASITTASGFTQRGTTQRVQSGTFQNGTPKYRSVTNKFAVMNLYILNKAGTRTALAQIVLGPTDALQFQPADADISAVQSFLQSGVHTTDVSTIASIAPSASAVAAVSSAPTDTSQNSAAYIALRRVQIVPRDYYVERDGFYNQIFYRADGKIFVTTPEKLWHNELTSGKYKNYGDQLAQVRQRLLDAGIDVGSFRRDPFPFETNGVQSPRVEQDFYTFFGITPQQGDPGIAAAASSTVPAQSTSSGTQPVQGATVNAPPAACAAQSLSAFYEAQGQSLPPLAARAPLYASLGLGQASFYTGTAEQNSKLLSTLQKQLGCAV